MVNHCKIRRWNTTFTLYKLLTLSIVFWTSPTSTCSEVDISTTSKFEGACVIWTTAHICNNCWNGLVNLLSPRGCLLYTWASGIPKVTLSAMTCDWHDQLTTIRAHSLQNWPWNRLTHWILTVNSRCAICKLYNRCTICKFFEIGNSCCTKDWVMSSYPRQTRGGLRIY